MNISVSEEEMNDAIQKALDKATLDAINQWEFQSSLKDAISKAFVEQEFFAAISAMLSQKLNADTKNLAEKIADQVIDSAVFGASAVIKETLASIVYKLRKPDCYMTGEEERKLMDNIRKELNK